MIEADYVVVGAGSAGCVLAARLSEDGRATVLLLEAGGEDRRRWGAMPLAWRDSYRDPAVHWGYAGEPEPQAMMRPLPAIRGRLVGGTGAINGMLYARGFPQDYDAWRDAGATGWSYEDVLPYFRKAEASWRGAGRYHGGDGPLAVSPHRPAPRLYEALGRTAERVGLERPDDPHASDADQFGVPDFTIARGRRASTAVAYLREARRRATVEVISGVAVERIVIEGGRAVAVTGRRDGEPVRVVARREVILCTGAFNSPQLLLLSGIGDAAALATLGIAPLVDLPGVGRNLQDHHAVNLSYRLSPDVAFDGALRLDRMAAAVVRWLAFGTGSAATVPVSGQVFRRIDAASRWPDMQMVITPVAHDARLWFPGWRRGVGARLAATNVLLRPRSTGSVTLRSPDPAAPPRIRFGVLADPTDRERFRAMIRFTQRFFATEPISRHLDGPVSPPGPLLDDAALDTFVRAQVGTAMHPAATCAIGSGRDAVLDPACRVRGVEALRVVDASAMPAVVSGNTNAPVIMMAERAADLIRRC